MWMRDNKLCGISFVLRKIRIKVKKKVPLQEFKNNHVLFLSHHQVKLTAARSQTTNNSKYWIYSLLSNSHNTLWIQPEIGNTSTKSAVHVHLFKAFIVTYEIHCMRRRDEREVSWLTESFGHQSSILGLMPSLYSRKKTSCCNRQLGMRVLCFLITFLIVAILAIPCTFWGRARGAEWSWRTREENEVRDP